MRGIFTRQACRPGAEIDEKVNAFLTPKPAAGKPRCRATPRPRQEKSDVER
jgi:hypothetical protein